MHLTSMPSLDDSGTNQTNIAETTRNKPATCQPRLTKRSCSPCTNDTKSSRRRWRARQGTLTTELLPGLARPPQHAIRRPTRRLTAPIATSRPFWFGQIVRFLYRHLFLFYLVSKRGFVNTVINEENRSPLCVYDEANTRSVG